MENNYREILIKRNPRSTDGLIRVGLIALTAAMAVLGIIFMPVFLLGAVAAGVACWLILPRLDVEYEYLYVGGDMDIDMIMSRQKRKRCCSLDLKDLETLSPWTGNASGGKVEDYTSGEHGKNTWAGVYRIEGEAKTYLLELDRELVDDMWKRAPRKVQRQER